jgi:NAD(P) transhydrogenase subunit alpha
MAVKRDFMHHVIVGAMLATALTETPLERTMGVLAVALAGQCVRWLFWCYARRMLNVPQKKISGCRACWKRTIEHVYRSHAVS